MINRQNLKLYLAVKNAPERSQMEDILVLDGFDIRTFSSARQLWTAFQQTPARLVISERRFPDGFSGLQLVRQIREHALQPYVYTVILSTLASLKEIREALAAGADDYLIRPANRWELRSRSLVGMRWLNYLDSLTAPETKAK